MVGVDPSETGSSLPPTTAGGAKVRAVGTIGPVDPPDAIGRAFPRLFTTSLLGDDVGAYWETYPPNRTGVWADTMSGWDERCQNGFDRVWPHELDDDVDALIDTYGSGWHTAFATIAPIRFPDLIDTLRAAQSDHTIRLTNLYRDNADITVDIALSEGPWRTTLTRRIWPYPTECRCAVCGASHYFDTVRPILVRRFGTPGICHRCREGAHVWGRPAPDDVDDDGLLAGIRALAATTGIVPPQDFRNMITTVGMPDDQRAATIAAMLCVPDTMSIRARFGGISWLEVLRAAGLVGATWRPSRGVLCTAGDGHPCRSLGERAIDDWLSRNGVAHDLEPMWPAHTELNPRGRMRADWRCGDVFIEYAGMMSTSEYAAKIAAKRSLAAVCGIDLIVVLPEDLYDLDSTLRRLRLTPPAPGTDPAR